MADNTVFSSKALVGQTLQGSYLIEKPVGKGGMAWVYRAKHTKLQEYMAVKVLLPHIAEDESVRKRFVDEGKIQFRLKHPNIVQVTDVIEDDMLIGIVMEWVDGEDLKELLKRIRSPIPIKDIWRLMAPVLDAVSYAHGKGLIHRDLKPANIMLHSEGDVIMPKVTDFGIAKIMDEAEESHTRTGIAMGTIKYMSPEQILDSKNVDQRADIYSLGVILYFMATARLPFKGESQLVIYKQLNEPPPPPSSYFPGISSAFEKVLMKCLERDREKRYQSCAELSHALSLALLESSGVKDGSTGSLTSAEVQEIMRALNDSDSNASFAGTGLSLEGLSGESSFLFRGRPSGVEHHVDGQAPKEPADKGKGRDHTFGSSADVGGAQDPAVYEDPTMLADDMTSIREPGFKPTWLIAAIVLIFGLGGGGWWIFSGTDTSGGGGGGQEKVAARQADAGDKPPVRRGSLKTVSEGSPCKVGQREPCYDGPKGTRNNNPCQEGLRMCQGGKFGRCIGQVLPKKELCNDKDDDCDGKVDEAFAKKGKSCSLKEGDCATLGSYVCNKKQTKLRCAAKAGSKSDGVYHVRLRIKPKKRMKIRYGGNNRTIRGRYCIEIKRATRLKIQASGYYTCAFTVKARDRTLRFRLKRRNPLGLDPSLGYCKPR